jgi:hypothetical protein
MRLGGKKAMESLNKSFNRNPIKQFLYACLMLTLFIPGLSFAATNHYVRAGATGNGSGSDWTNAFNTLPEILVRGDTYYIATGNYLTQPYVQISTAVSGTSIITIKKATVDDHGTDIGWNVSYGSGQALWPVTNIITSYIVLDGVIGSGSNPNSYGFSIIPSVCNTASVALGVPGVGYSSLVISNVTISHISIINCGASYDHSQQGIYSLPASASNITVSNNYLSNSSTNMLIAFWSNSTISHNYFKSNWSSASFHGEQLSPRGTSNISLNDNVFEDSLVFVVGFHDAPGAPEPGNAGWKIFNNLIIGGSPNSGAFASLTSPYNCFRSSEVHHNTFANVGSMGSHGAVWAGNVTNAANKIYVYNNVFYNSANPRLDNAGGTPGMVVHTDNSYFNCSGSYDKTEDGTAEIGTGDPFVDSANNNFDLRIPLSLGKVLSSPFDKDYLGRQRVNYYRGAFEYKKISPITTLE